MANILLLLNTLISFTIFIILAYSAFKFSKKNHLKKISILLFLIAIAFILFFIISLFWYLNFQLYNSLDLLFIHSLVTFFNSILILLIIFILKKSRKFFYLLLIYLIPILSSFIGLDFSNLLLISSLLLMLILFILLISSPSFSTSSKFAIFYSSISLFLQSAIIFQKEFSPVICIISNSFFLVFIFFFLIDIIHLPSQYFENKKPKSKHSSYLFDFLRYFVFIIILTNFIFIGVLSIHEGGHFLISKLNPNCSLERIVYEGGLPHTEIICNNSVESMNLTIFGGILLPILVALLLFFGGGTFMKEISLLIIGFDILISYKDFMDLGFSQNISVFFSIFGAAIILIAIGILAKSRTTEEEFIHLGES